MNELAIEKKTEETPDGSLELVELGAVSTETKGNPWGNKNDAGIALCFSCP